MQKCVYAPVRIMEANACIASEKKDFGSDIIIFCSDKFASEFVFFFLRLGQYALCS